MFELVCFFNFLMSCSIYSIQVVCRWDLAGFEVTDQPLISSMPMTSTTNSQTKQTQALGHAAENALDSPLAPHEALQDGNRCPSTAT